MFRDSEIIDQINKLTLRHEKFLEMADSEFEMLRQKIEDLQDTCDSLKDTVDEHLEAILSSEALKELLKQAMREFKEEMETPKKVIKKK